MSWLIAIVSLIVLLFGFVVLFGAPYLPTLKKQTQTALDLLDLKPGQTLLELGCGDGRVLKAAAQRGLKGVGYELNPILVVIAKLYTWRYRKTVQIIWGNYWTQPWPQADGIFVFLLNKYMLKLDNKIIHEMQSWRLAASDSPVRAHRTPTGMPRLRASNLPSDTSKLASREFLKVVSFAFQITDKKPDKQKDGLYLYIYR